MKTSFYLFLIGWIVFEILRVGWGGGICPFPHTHHGTGSQEPHSSRVSNGAILCLLIKGDGRWMQHVLCECGAALLCPQTPQSEITGVLKKEGRGRVDSVAVMFFLRTLNLIIFTCLPTANSAPFMFASRYRDCTLHCLKEYPLSIWRREKSHQGFHCTP